MVREVANKFDSFYQTVQKRIEYWRQVITVQSLIPTTLPNLAEAYQFQIYKGKKEVGNMPNITEQEYPINNHWISM